VNVFTGERLLWAMKAFAGRPRDADVVAKVCRGLAAGSAG
jgi:hypothetical protein